MGDIAVVASKLLFFLVFLFRGFNIGVCLLLLEPEELNFVTDL